MKGNDINGDTFVFFPTFVPQLRAIKNKEVELRMRYAIEDYGIDGILPDFSDIDPLGLMDGMFEQFKFLIDSAKAKRKEQSKTNSKNGKKGGAQPGNQNARKQPNTSENERKQPNTSETSLNVNGNGNVTHKFNKLNCVCNNAHTHTHNGEDESNYGKFMIWLKDNTPYIYEHLTLPTEKEFDKLREALGPDKIGDLCSRIENRTDLRERYKSLYRTLVTWAKREME